MTPTLLIASFAFLLALCALPARAQVVVIANAGLQAADVSFGDLRDVFTGAALTLTDGSRVRPVLLKPGAVNDRFLSTYVGKSNSMFRANWRSLLASAEGVMPPTLDSEAAVVEFVAQNPGAIGYIARTTPHDGVKTLAVR